MSLSGPRRTVARGGCCKKRCQPAECKKRLTAIGGVYATQDCQRRHSQAPEAAGTADVRFLSRNMVLAKLRIGYAEIS